MGLEPIQLRREDKIVLGEPVYLVGETGRMDGA